MTSEEENNNASSINNENILNHPLNKEMKTSYINYAMSVIIGRAYGDLSEEQLQLSASSDAVSVPSVCRSRV